MDSNQWEQSQNRFVNLMAYNRRKTVERESKRLSSYDENFLKMMKIVPDLSLK